MFYPKGLPQRRELEFASRVFPSIELNGSFYSLQRPENYARWYSETPPGFVFSVKAPRFITHIKRLRDIDAPLANFFASGVANLGEKLGPILWQLPPSMRYDAPIARAIPGIAAAGYRGRLETSPPARRQGHRARADRFRAGARACATRWKCATTASSIPGSSNNCADIASRW